MVVSSVSGMDCPSVERSGGATVGGGAISKSVVCAILVRPGRKVISYYILIKVPLWERVAFYIGSSGETVKLVICEYLDEDRKPESMQKISVSKRAHHPKFFFFRHLAFHVPFPCCESDGRDDVSAEQK